MIYIHRWYDRTCRKLKDFTKKLLELMHEFSKIARYKSQHIKSAAFLCRNYLKKFKTIPFMTATTTKINFFLKKKERRKEKLTKNSSRRWKTCTMELQIPLKEIKRGHK